MYFLSVLNASLKIAEKMPKQVRGFNSGVLAYKVNSLMTVVATTEICRRIIACLCISASNHCAMYMW